MCRALARGIAAGAESASPRVQQQQHVQPRHPPPPVPPPAHHSHTSSATALLASLFNPAASLFSSATSQPSQVEQRQTSALAHGQLQHQRKPFVGEWQASPLPPPPPPPPPLPVAHSTSRAGSTSLPRPSLDDGAGMDVCMYVYAQVQVAHGIRHCVPDAYNVHHCNSVQTCSILGMRQALYTMNTNQCCCDGVCYPCSPCSCLPAASAIQAAEVAAAYEELRVSRFGLPPIPPAMPQPRPPSLSGHARYPQQGGPLSHPPPSPAQETYQPLAPAVRQHLSSLTPEQVTVEQVELICRDLVALSRQLPPMGGPTPGHMHLLLPPHNHQSELGQGHGFSGSVRLGGVPHLMAEWRELLWAVQTGGR
jgi:hypothetical protein